LNLSVWLEFLLRNKRLARVSTPPYSFGSSFNASISIWFGFLIKIIQICGIIENQPLKIATVRDVLFILSVSFEFLLKNKRLVRVSTPPYAFGLGFCRKVAESSAQATQIGSADGLHGRKCCAGHAD
jgi:hypothetical protein